VCRINWLLVSFLSHVNKNIIHSFIHTKFAAYVNVAIGDSDIAVRLCEKLKLIVLYSCVGRFCDRALFVESTV